MFIHNIDPTLLQIGTLEIRYYGLIYVLSFIAVFFYLNYLIKHKKLPLTKEQLYDYILFLVIGVMLGGRLFHVFVYNPSYYLHNPLQIFAVWRGGMAFHGALIAIIVTTYLFAKKIKLNFYKLADLIAIPGAIFLFFGRIANFINGELFGHITNLPWAVKFQNIPGFRHPSQIYEALKNLLIFSILLFQSKKKHKPGFLFWHFILLYGLFRFIIEFYRFSPNYYFGLSIGQYLCILMFIPAAYFLLKDHLPKK